MKCQSGVPMFGDISEVPMWGDISEVPMWGAKVECQCLVI